MFDIIERGFATQEKQRKHQFFSILFKVGQFDNFPFADLLTEDLQVRIGGCHEWQI